MSEKQGQLPQEPEIKRLTLDLPATMLRALNQAADARGMTRQSLIKSWLYDRLLEESKN
jgi:hypothetical protein